MSASFRVRLVGAFAAIYLMWGGTFLAIRYAVADIPPLMTVVLRCGGGAALLFAWLVWRGSLERATRAQWITAGVAGAFLFLGCHGLLAWAEQQVSSGEAALFMTAIPLWLITLESFLLRRMPSRRVMLSLLLGVGGVAVLTGAEGWSGGIGVRAVLVLSALFWAVGTLIVRRAGRPLPAAQSTAMQLGGGSLVLLVASASAGELAGWTPGEITPRAALALAFLVLGGTVLGFGAYTWLLRVTSSAAVSTYAFVNPVIALGLAWLVGDGGLSPRTGVAAALVVAAVVLTRETKPRSEPDEEPSDAVGSRAPARARGGRVVPALRRWYGGLRAPTAGAALRRAESRARAGAGAASG